MAFFNYATMQMAAKVVYYGAGLCGKTTNLQYIYNKTSPKSRGEMVSLETESDRTLFFDLLPLEVGVIAGFKTRFQLYTVPGQVFYGETRRMVLKGVDGVVFVADSQRPMREANIESLKDLEKNLQDMGVNLADVPLVLQFNKRDLPNLLTVEELNRDLNWCDWSYFNASAVNGMGVFDTLKGISRLTLHALKGKLARPAETVAQPAAPPPAAAPELSRPAEASPVTAALPPPPPPPLPSAVEVEFAALVTAASDKELARRAPKLKTVTTTSLRVASELDRIRESLLGPILSAARPKVKDLTPQLDDLRRASLQHAPAEPVLEVPPKALQGLDSLGLRVTVKEAGGGEAFVGDLTVGSDGLQRAGDGWIVRIRLAPKQEDR
jgi:signal recognition particle receptor subunit beta